MKNKSLSEPLTEESLIGRIVEGEGIDEFEARDVLDMIIENIGDINTDINKAIGEYLENS